MMGHRNNVTYDDISLKRSSRVVELILQAYIDADAQSRNLSHTTPGHILPLWLDFCWERLKPADAAQGWNYGGVKKMIGARKHTYWASVAQSMHIASRVGSARYEDCLKMIRDGSLVKVWKPPSLSRRTKYKKRDRAKV